MVDWICGSLGRSLIAAAILRCFGFTFLWCKEVETHRQSFFAVYDHMSDNMVDVVCPFTDHYFIINRIAFFNHLKQKRRQSQSSYIFFVSFFQTIKVDDDRSFHSAWTNDDRIFNFVWTFHFRNTTKASKHCFKLCKHHVVNTHSITFKCSLSLQYVFTHFTWFHVNLFEFILSFSHLRMSVTE